MLNLLSLSTLSGWIFSRNLQEIPDYTSPPLDIALAATPEKFRNDTYLDLIREAAGSKNCNDNPAMENCQILFTPSTSFSPESSKIGVIFYGGALVDPRSYSVLAETLSNRYGFAVSIPIFPNDIAYEGCNGTNRISLAIEAFPEVEKWVLAGHSLGGVGVQLDFRLNVEKNNSKIGGLVLIASEFREDICGKNDFSHTHFPMAGVYASLDNIINSTNVESGKKFFPENDTLYVDIIGGNHGYFGYYNYSLGLPLLGQIDGNATIPRSVQHDLTTGAIAHVAARMGLPLPSLLMTDTTTREAASPASIDYSRGFSSNSIIILTSIVSLFIWM